MVLNLFHIYFLQITDAISHIFQSDNLFEWILQKCLLHYHVLFCTQFLQGFSPPSSWNVVVLLWPELIFIILVLFPTFFNPDEFSLHYIYQLLFFKIPIKLDDIWLCCFHFPHFKFCWFLLPNSIFAILTHNIWYQLPSFFIWFKSF